LCTFTKCPPANKLAFLAACWFPVLSFALTPLQRLEARHLEAVHAQRVEWKKRRLMPEPHGLYQDYRAVFTKEFVVRGELARAAREAEADVVFSTVPSGEEDGVLFLPNPPYQGFPALEPSQRVSVDVRWLRALRKQKDWTDEAFGSATEADAESLARWDRDSHAAFLMATAPAQAPARTVAFRNSSVHILARERTPQAILGSLREQHSYVAHDWLCDPTGFQFLAENNLGVFEMGDEVLAAPNAGATSIRAQVAVPAELKLLRNGTMVAESSGTAFEYPVQQEGAYRLEAWLKVDGESRPWIYSNPLYVKKAPNVDMPSGETPATVDYQKDITYVEGSQDDKQRLDLYLPRGKQDVPVLMFLHGGSWSMGDRALYRALGNRLAREGIAVAIPSYRLMPQHEFPAQVEDSAAAFDWVYRNIARYGGDRSRVYVAGHSAGGHLASLLALDPQYLAKFNLNTSLIHGVVSLSGVYDLRWVRGFRTEVVKHDASPIHHTHSGAPRFLVAYCQRDYFGLPKQARDFSAALKKAFVDTKLVYVPLDNHITEIINVAREQGPLLDAILKFVQ
jgi:acetyl esterase/lipase